MTLAEATRSSITTYSSGWWASSRMPGPIGDAALEPADPVDVLVIVGAGRGDQRGRPSQHLLDRRRGRQDHRIIVSGERRQHLHDVLRPGSESRGGPGAAPPEFPSSSALTSARSSSIRKRRSSSRRQLSGTSGEGRPSRSSPMPPWIAARLRVERRASAGTTGIAVSRDARRGSSGARSARAKRPCGGLRSRPETASSRGRLSLAARPRPTTRPDGRCTPDRRRAARDDHMVDPRPREPAPPGQPGDPAVAAGSSSAVPDSSSAPGKRMPACRMLSSAITARGDAALHVAGAAAVQPAVLHHAAERVDGPAAAGLDHVDVTVEVHAGSGALAVVAADHVAARVALAVAYGPLGADMGDLEPGPGEPVAQQLRARPIVIARRVDASGFGPAAGSARPARRAVPSIRSNSSRITSPKGTFVGRRGRVNRDARGQALSCRAAGSQWPRQTLAQGRKTMCTPYFVDEAMKQKIAAYNAAFREVSRSPFGADDQIGMLNLIDARLARRDREPRRRRQGVRSGGRSFHRHAELDRRQRSGLPDLDDPHAARRGAGQRDAGRRGAEPPRVLLGRCDLDVHPLRHARRFAEPLRLPRQDLQRLRRAGSSRQPALAGLGRGKTSAGDRARHPARRRGPARAGHAAAEPSASARTIWRTA